jgi:hypothetical protein
MCSSLPLFINHNISLLSVATLNWGKLLRRWRSIYDVEYETWGVGAYTWRTPCGYGTTSLSYNLSGLLTSTNYDWRVHAHIVVPGAGNYILASFSTTILRIANSNLTNPIIVLARHKAINT